MTAAEQSAEIDCSRGHACTFCPVELTCTLNKPRHNRVLIEARLQEIDQIVLVMANKGGVGKSTVSANLASGLARRGFRVGVADCDVHGPNQSRFFGFAGHRVRVRDTGIGTLSFAHEGLAFPIEIGSLGFLLEAEDTPVVWRDSYKHDFVHHLIGSFDWGPLDFMIVDMPPGTGNELITICDLLEGANVSALLVTTTQAVALMDSLKAARFCRERGLPMIGVAENMAGVVCPHCEESFHVFPDGGLDDALKGTDVARARIPLSIDLALASDEGVPVVAGAPDTVVAKAFAPLVDAFAALGSRDFGGAVARGLDEVFAANLDPAVLEEMLGNVDPDLRATLKAELAEGLSEESARLHAAANHPGVRS